MPLFLCRWVNGDCSVVLARNKEDAIVELDEVANAERCPIERIRAFQVHFVLTDRGELALEGFGEGTRDEIFSFAYPLLDKALLDAYGDGAYGNYESLPPDRRAAIAHCVEQERGRLEPDEALTAEPLTEIGRDIKTQTDMPTVLIDRIVRQVATKKLKNFKGPAKPS